MNVTRLQFPPQTGPYAIKVKEGDQWHGYKTVRLEISVGQNYHEGEKLACTINWATSRFDNVVILCNDTLQRYNFALQVNDHSPEDFLNHTRLMGSQWIERNESSLSNVAIARWDDWINLPQFNRALKDAWNLYENNHQFQIAVNHSISEVYKRRLSKGLISQEQHERFQSLSLDYLMEETAGLALAYENFPGVSAYPGSFLEMWRMFVGRPIEGPLKGLSNAHCIRIDFDRKNQGVAQTGEPSLKMAL